MSLLLDESKISVSIRVTMAELRMIINALEEYLEIDGYEYEQLATRIKAKLKAIYATEMETVIVSDKTDVNIKSTQENESPGEV